VHDLQPLPPAAQQAKLDAIAGAIPVYEIGGQPDVGSLTALILGPHRSYAL
jgi:hypothetical protein